MIEVIRHEKITFIPLWEHYIDFDFPKNFFHIQCKFTGLDVTSDKIKSQIDYMKVICENKEILKITPEECKYYNSYPNSIYINLVSYHNKFTTQIHNYTYTDVIKCQFIIKPGCIKDIDGCDIYIIKM